MAYKIRREGGYVPAETHVEWTSPDYINGGGLTVPILTSHGGGGDVEQYDAANPNAMTDLNAFANQGGVVIGNHDQGGGDTWGNAAAQTAISNYVTYLGTQYGVDTNKVCFVGDSHGTINVIKWATDNPSRFGAAVCRVPCVDIKEAYDRDPLGLVRPAVVAAWGSEAAYLAARPTIDPSHPTWLAAIRASGVAPRIQLYYNINDGIILKDVVLARAAEMGMPTPIPLDDRRFGFPGHEPWPFLQPGHEWRFLRSRARF